MLDAQRGEGPGDQVRSLGAADLSEAKAEGGKPGYGGPEEERILYDHCDRAAEGGDSARFGKYRPPPKENLAGRWLIESAEDFEECRFAGAVRAGD